MINLVSDTIDRDDINDLISWLSQDNIPRLTKGDITKEIEAKWSKKLDTKYTVYVNSGSAALLLTCAALQYHNIKNKKIIVPNLSWATDISSPHLLGYDVHLVDCNLHDLSVDLNHLEQLFEKERPSCFILVSVLGLVPDMDSILSLCKEYGVRLIEDVCESMGSKYKGKMLGSFGIASCFSLYYGHHLSTIEGGFISTSNTSLYNLLVSMRSHGWDRDCDIKTQQLWREENNIDEFSGLFTFYYPGLNCRSTDLQAKIGLRQVDKLDTFAKNRNKNFNYYHKNIKNNKLNIKVSKENFISSFAYPMLVDDRNKIVKKLQDNNVEVRPLIAGAMHKKPYIKNFLKSQSIDNFPNCELLDNNGLYLPNHQNLSTKDLELICSIVNE